MNYEQVFQDEYTRQCKIEGDEGNGYKELCLACEEAFKAAGFDIPGNDLHRKYHNYIVSSVRNFETLSDVAKSFLGWIREPDSSQRSYLTNQVIKGEFPRWLFDRGPKVSIVYVQSEINRALKEKRIRRGTKRYNELIQAKAESVIGYMLEAARIAIADYRAKVEKEAEAVEKENREAESYLAHLVNLIQVVKAFRKVGNCQDYRPEIEGFLAEEHKAIRKGLESRRESLRFYKTKDIDPMSLVKDAARLDKDIAAFLEAYKNQSVKEVA